MASYKFENDSKERELFADLYVICQKYWNAEKDDKYWKEMLKDVSDFNVKYPCELASRWIADFIIVKENESRGSNE